MNKKTNLRAIIKEFVNDYPWHFGLLFFLLVVEGFVATFSIMTLIPLTDFLLDPSLLNPSRITAFVIVQLTHLNLPISFLIFGGLFVASNVIKGMADISIRYAILRIKYAVGRGLMKNTLNTFLKARWSFFSESEQGKLQNTLNRELNVVGDTLGALATLLAQVIQLCIYLAVPFWLNAKVTFIALALAILFGTPFIFLQRLSYRLGRRNTETANLATGILNEILSAARLVLSFGRQKQAEQKYLVAFDRHIGATLRSQVLATAISKLFQPLGMLALVVALGFALQKQIPIAELVAVMWSLLAAMPLISGLLQGKITINNFLPSYEQLISLRVRAAALQEVVGERTFHTLKTGIEFKSLTFAYPARLPTLVSVDLFIRKDSLTALVGESGSGKSTIADLMLGLQVPSQGQVLIDEIPLGEWQQNSFREKVGFVPQDPQLFHASIRENLLWGFSQASERDIWTALSLANATEFIQQLPEGLDTIVGDRGVRMSGGQRQRLALARALLRKPELLILDEATSALDSESEGLIQDSIERIAHSTTILLITHRLSTIARANQVYVLRKGCIVEEGSFLKLSRDKSSVLHGMLQTQSTNL